MFRNGDQMYSYYDLASLFIGTGNIVRRYTFTRCTEVKNRHIDPPSIYKEHRNVAFL